MFEIGKTYWVKMIEEGIETSFGGMEVVSVDFPLVKFLQGTQTRIINTASSSFIEAIPDEFHGVDLEKAVLESMR